MDITTAGLVGILILALVLIRHFWVNSEYQVIRTLFYVRKNIDDIWLVEFVDTKTIEFASKLLTVTYNYEWLDSSTYKQSLQVYFGKDKFLVIQRANGSVTLLKTDFDYFNPNKLSDKETSAVLYIFNTIEDLLDT